MSKFISVKLIRLVLSKYTLNFTRYGIWEMNNGYIIGLGFILIVLSFYIFLNLPYWVLIWKERNNNEKTEDKKYPLWVYTSNDSLNKFLIFCIYGLYGYGIYVIFLELLIKFS